MGKNKILENIKKEAKRIIEDSEYSAKGHFESARYWRCVNCVLMLVSMASVCTSLAFVNGIFEWGIWISIVSAFITMLLVFLNPQEKYLFHHKSGNKYLVLRNKTRIFLEIESKNMRLEQQTEYLKKLDSKRNKINKRSLPITSMGYKSAKKQIETDKNTQYQVDKEQK